MTHTCTSHRRLLTVCWLSLFVAWPHVLPIGLAQEQPPGPPQVEQPAAIKDGAAAEAMKDAAVEIVVEDEAVVDLIGMRARAQNPQMSLLNGYVRVNCALARRACKLSEEEEQKLSQLDSAWLEKQLKESIASPVKEVAAGIARFLGGRAVAEVININGNQGDPQQAAIPKVKQRIDTAIEEALEFDHKEVFLRERESRDQFRKQAMAAVLVSVLDERVFLTQQQRDDLEPEVGKWLTKDLYWQFYFQNANFIPDIPKRMLSQVLSAEQLESLEGARSWNYETSQIEMQLMQEEPIVIER